MVLKTEQDTDSTKNTKETYEFNEQIYNSLLPKNELWIMNPLRQWEKRMGFLTPLIWLNVIAISFFHILGVVSIIYLNIIIDKLIWKTILFAIFTGVFSGFGVTAGAHRYWCHRSYKAKGLFEILLLFCYSIAGQNTVFDWVRDHRVHHKYSETKGDPHDSNRGFFFSHVGWLMMKKHPEVLRRGKSIDMSDIVEDPYIAFHTRFFVLFKAILCFIIPTLIPIYFWNETHINAVICNCLIRYMFGLNFTWSVNSFAHIWGNKPYDSNISPVENASVSVFALGEGWHNYHHTFPWDYKASELGSYSLNITTAFLDLAAKLGLIYDMKEAPKNLIDNVVAKRGDNDIRKTQ